MSILSEENMKFERDGKWRTSQIGSCTTCGWTCSGYIWRGDPCGKLGCNGKIGETRPVAGRGGR